jgi:hypothetical protein
VGLDDQSAGLGLMLCDTDRSIRVLFFPLGTSDFGLQFDCVILLDCCPMLQVEAEKHPDISGAYEVGVVPYFVFFKVHPDNRTLNFFSFFFSLMYMQ